ncbi:DUF1292 domain-containing protein [Fodinisporobacter ferrooxydans]|uniref:DUF1292 domain-containing protein n=1 Tax=Fodinisporobacter ferrooxydans TaxID=2901836 RepID=A0ABY4CJI8_9BACL|nr:DUF1292 domain-containing protein [Alicyclobacillaceae bacterium MYW30-H2]
MSCSCGSQAACDCETPKMLYLADEWGQSHPFYIADRLYVNDQAYAFLISTEQSDQYALLKVVADENGAETFVNIADESEWDAIEKTLFEEPSRA